MSGRHLPLFAPPVRPAAPHAAARRVLPGRALIVADTDADVLALTWALGLVEELAVRQRAPAVVLTSFAGGLDAALERFARLPGAGSVCALGAEALGDELTARAPAAGALWVLVGQPALLACEAWRTVLLAADAPLLRWAPGLRGVRATLSLELSGAGLPVARELGRLLAAL